MSVSSGLAHRAVVSDRRSVFGPRGDVLAHLRQCAEPQSVDRIAQELGLRPNTARYHLDLLVRDGLAVRQAERPSRRGRPRMLYAAASPDPDAAAQSYRSLADALMHQLVALPIDANGAAEEAGYAWGSALAAHRPGRAGLVRVVEALGEVGHDMTLIGAPAIAIELQPCPFDDLLATAGDAVCRLHLGLMRGLVCDDERLAIAGLRRRLAPGACVVHLAKRRCDPPSGSETAAG